MPRQCPDRSNLMNLRRNDAEIGTAVIFPHLGRGEGAGRGGFPNFPPRQRDKRSDLSTVPASLVSGGTSVSLRDTRGATYFATCPVGKLARSVHLVSRPPSDTYRSLPPGFLPSTTPDQEESGVAARARRRTIPACRPSTKSGDGATLT